MERSTAIAAAFSARVGCAQPVAARSALLIDALHSPSRQILHAFPPRKFRAIFSDQALVTREARKKLREFCSPALVVSIENIQFLVVALQIVPVTHLCAPNAALRESPARFSFPLYNLCGLAHNLSFRYVN